MWEVERSLDAYYATIKRPVCFAAIAAALLQEGYSRGLEARQFFTDMTLVAANTFTFNTELLPYSSQAQKCWQATHRHMQRWVVGCSPPPLEQCSEAHCLLTGALIVSNQVGVGVGLR